MDEFVIRVLIGRCKREKSVSMLVIYFLSLSCVIFTRPDQTVHTRPLSTKYDLSAVFTHVRIQRGGGGPDPPEKSQKYRFS